MLSSIARLIMALLPVLVACLIGLGGERWRLGLRYDRDALLADGEWWRLLTGHVVHLNPSHLLLDGLSFLVIALMFVAMTPMWLWWGALVAAAVTIDAALLVMHPELDWYVGLSGVIHGVFVVGALRTLEHHRTEGAVMLILLAAKLAWEVLVGPMPWSESASRGPVVEEVHLYGTLGGAILWWVAALLPRRRWQHGPAP
jgi:rhomboid family GlyGly-CTERM serine protease